MTASFSPCATKVLKSDSSAVAMSACARIAVVGMRQSNREPRRRPVWSNNPAATTGEMDAEIDLSWNPGGSPGLTLGCW